MRLPLFIIQGLCVLLFCCMPKLFAQSVTPGDSIKIKSKEPKYGKVSILVSTTILLQNRESLKVFLVCSNDTINNGYEKLEGFLFEKVPVGVARAYVWADGFVTDSDTLTVREGELTKKSMYLTDRVLQLKAVMVKGHTPAMVYRGDTIRFNPNNLNLSDDDMVRTILEQMPGVKITDGGINVMGKEVEKTYVDGKKIFGENPMTAVDHVQATDVLNIYAYDEDERKEQIKKNRRGRRRRVLNIETKSKMINSSDGNMLVGAGGNMGKQELSSHDVRYVAGGCFNFFSEQMLLSINAMHNNENVATNNSQMFLRSNNPSPIYSVNSFAGFNLSRRWEETPGYFKEIRGGYQFSRKASENNQQEERDYYPTESFNQRSYKSHNYTADRKNEHAANIGFGLNDKKWGQLNIDYSFSTDHIGREAQQKIENRVEEVISTALLNQQIRNKKQKMYGTLSWLKFIGDLQYTLDVKYDHQTSDETEHRENRMGNAAQENLQEVLLIPSDELGNKWQVRSELQWNLARKDDFFQRYIKVGYEWNQDNRHIHRLAWNKLTGEPDETNTYSYRSQLTHHTVQVEILPLNTDKFNMILGGGWQHAIVEDQKKTLLAGSQNIFNVPVAEILVGTGEGNMKKFSVDLNYKVNAQLPNVVQLRSEMSNSNPYFLSSGNPNLKATIVHTVALHQRYRFNDYGHSISSQLSVSMQHNSIANRTLYFEKETYLPEWNYTAIANSSFRTYENMGGAWNLGWMLDWSCPLDKIKSNLIFILAHEYEHTPYYYDEVRDIARINRLFPSVSFSTNLIPKTFLNIRLWSRYQTSKNDVSDYTSKIWTNGVTCQLNFKSIAKYGFAKLYYAYRIQNDKTLQNKEMENVLNLYAGVKLFKRRGELSVTAYDVLHSYKNRRVRMTDNYTTLSENENYGRYFSVNFTWIFRKIKSNRMDISRGVSW